MARADIRRAREWAPDDPIAPQSDHPSMSLRDSWILSKAAVTSYELQAPSHSCCSLDEAMTLANYLNGEMKVKTAARCIAAQFSTPMTTIGTPSRIWRLLIQTAMEFFDDSHELILELLLHMQKLSHLIVPWSRIHGFMHMWQILYQTKHIHLSRIQTSDEEGIEHRKRFYKNAGIFEAKMLILEVPDIDEFWAYRTINVISSRRLDINCVIYEIHAWLQIAGAKLAELLDPDQVKSFERQVRGRSDKHYELQVTMFEHWQHWKKSFLQASYEEELTSDARELARECHEMMKAQNIRFPTLVNTSAERDHGTVAA